MRLILHRRLTDDGATVGELHVEDEIGRLAWTLEDAVREVEGAPVETWKLPGQTAIPRGEYRVAITPSARFARRMPILLDVPGFSGIRIHSGNTARDTDGCILVGLTRVGAAVYQSRAAFAAVYARIEETLLAAQEVRISIA